MKSAPAIAALTVDDLAWMFSASRQSLLPVDMPFYTLSCIAA